MKQIFTLLTILLFIISCKSERQKSAEISNPSGSKQEYVSDSTLLAEVNAKPDVPAPKFSLKNFTNEDVAKFAIAITMGRSPQIISAYKDGENYIVSYNRSDDGKRFTYKVKVEPHRAIWANIDGRWRDLPDDGRITFEEVGNKLKMTETYSDGSANEKEYTK